MKRTLFANKSLLNIFLITALSVTIQPTTSLAAENSNAQATEKSISRYPVPKLDELPKDIKKILLDVQKKRGFIPNVLIALAHRPDELRAFLAYNNAVMNKKSGLTKAEKQMLIIAFSSYNKCSYCIISHGATLRLVSNNPTISDQITANYKEADVTPRERAIMDFGIKITKDSGSINEEDFKKLRSHGLSDEDIWDIAGITAFYNLSNRMMNFAKVRPDEELYMMGRKQP